MALQPCTACNHPISTDAAACPHCGHPMNRQKLEPTKPKHQSRHIVFIICLLVIGLVVLSQCSDDQPTASRAPPAVAKASSPPSAPPPKAPAQKALERGHNMLKLMADPNAEWPGPAWFQQAIDALRAIPTTAPQYAEAQMILADHQTHEAAWTKAHDAIVAKRDAANQAARNEQLEQKRIAYRALLEDQMLSKGLNVDVALSGKKHDRLLIKYALTSKVTAYQFSHSKFPEQWSSLGFRKVVLTDGYDESYSWDFDP